MSSKFNETLVNFSNWTLILSFTSLPCRRLGLMLSRESLLSRSSCSVCILFFSAGAHVSCIYSNNISLSECRIPETPRVFESSDLFISALVERTPLRIWRSLSIVAPSASLPSSESRFTTGTTFLIWTSLGRSPPPLKRSAKSFFWPLSKSTMVRASITGLFASCRMEKILLFLSDLDCAVTTAITRIYSWLSMRNVSALVLSCSSSGSATTPGRSIRSSVGTEGVLIST
mmetsp:Transcript_11278/g.20847  ORF Transcript_11278/g.20847 Transcript_11278/m.20847 type:complete len:230 (-) Transcript_11278:725-1414(-)